MPVRRKTTTTTVTRTAKRRKASTKRRGGGIAKLSLRLLETKKKETRGQEIGVNTLAGWHVDAGHMILSQNDTYSGLEGHIVRGKGISIHGWVRNNATTTVVLRMGMMLVKNGEVQYSAFAAGTAVLEGDTSNAVITTAGSAQRLTQRFNQDQYKILSQKYVKLAASSSTDASDVRQFSFWIPLKGKPFRYDGPDKLPTKNVVAFYMVPCLANNDESAGEFVELTYTSTFYYVDP